jgi:hypothetical protein
LGENIFSLTTDPSLSFGTKFGLLTCIWGLGQFCGNIYWPSYIYDRYNIA